MSDVIELGPHANMTVEEALQYATRNQDGYEDVIIVSTSKESGKTMISSSFLSRADALWILLNAVDHARGKDDGN